LEKVKFFDETLIVITFTNNTTLLEAFTTGTIAHLSLREDK
jgi:hypothetical protein